MVKLCFRNSKNNLPEACGIYRCEDRCVYKKKLSKIQKKLKIRLVGKVGSLRSNVKKSEYLPGGAESLHLLFSVWHSGYTYPLSLKGAPLSTPLKSLGTNATPEYYPN